MAENYDVIIVGAGPAGVSIASELAGKVNVLVMDKKSELKSTTRSWFIPKVYLEIGEAHDIEPYTYPGVKRFLADTFTGVEDKAWEAQLKEGYLYIKEHEVLGYWGKKARESGAKFEFDCFYLDHEVNKESKDTPVTIHTSKGNYTCKLLVDASGYDSMILKKYDMEKKENYYWWSVYGQVLEHKAPLAENVEVGDYMFWQTFANTNPDYKLSLQQGRPVFEYEIFTENTSFPLVLYLRKDKVPVDVMKSGFEEIMREKKVAPKFKDTVITEEKYGWYPSGSISQYLAKDHVAFAGDAACWTTPCGWGYAFIVKNYKKYAANLLKAFEEDKFSDEELCKLIDLNVDEKFQILFNTIATRTLSVGDTTLLDRIINLFDKIGFIYCEKTFTLTLTPLDVVKIIGKMIEELGIETVKLILPYEDAKQLLTTSDKGGVMKPELEESHESLMDKIEEGVEDLFEKVEDVRKKLEEEAISLLSKLFNHDVESKE